MIYVSPSPHRRPRAVGCHEAGCGGCVLGHGPWQVAWSLIRAYAYFSGAMQPLPLAFDWFITHRCAVGTGWGRVGSDPVSDPMGSDTEVSI
eukprot:5223484-Prymnesium_polylepis.1